ncbi:MAG TPA: hypothetical protein VMT69_07240, partial [Kineosporiaceae bacterium]|nr:hypothetical protein [Kineosporiaceae bacterium]
GGSKDTWVLAAAAETSPGRDRAGRVPAQWPVPMREPDPGPPPSRPGQHEQQQQQQQQQHRHWPGRAREGRC